MLAQGVLGFQYQAERGTSGTTALGGLPIYLDLAVKLGLTAAIRRFVRVAGAQGWLDLQMVLALIFLNLAGGESVEDLERLEHDAGFQRVLREIERGVLSRSERRSLKSRWRKQRSRAVPSPSSALEWLSRFHDETAEQARVAGKAFIWPMTEALRSLWQVNQSLVASIQAHHPETVATLDMDATLIETSKRQAFHCYKGFKAYQPLNCWCAEPENRSDPAERALGVIEFAVSADVTREFRKAVLSVSDADWRPLYRPIDGVPSKTDQEWAEVCFVPSWAGNSRNRAEYRFIALREPFGQLDIGDADQLPFPTEEFDKKGRMKLFGIVTNRNIPGDEVIWWLRERCGKSEEVHAVMKDDLAGGRLPSGRFGANAAWWATMILSHNLNAAMKRLVLGPNWVSRRLKAVRYHLINLPGRVVSKSRQLIIRISETGHVLARLLAARRTIRDLQPSPPG